jgi:hypothetical protein
VKDDLRSVPTLDELGADPTKTAVLPVEVASAMLRQCAAKIAAYQALSEALRIRIAASGAAHHHDGEQLVGAEEVARMLGRGKSWVEHHLDELPPRRSLLGQPVWIRRDVERWIVRLPTYGTPC